MYEKFSSDKGETLAELVTIKQNIYIIRIVHCNILLNEL
jgi:hypothetical protein